MKHYLKSALAYEKVELKLLATYDYIDSLLSNFWSYDKPSQFYSDRTLYMIFGFPKGTDLSPLYLALEQGYNHLKMLMDSGDISYNIWSYETSLVAQYNASLEGFEQIRYEMTIYDKDLNELLDNNGVSGVLRIGYFSYAIDCYRLKIGFNPLWGRNWLVDALGNLRKADNHKTLDDEICYYIELIIFGKEMRTKI